jgi:tetratricopeptide (TPR) repeat protein
MDVLTIIGITATVVGIIAGVVQVVQYAQDRRKRLDTPEEQAPAAPTLVVAQIPHNLPPRTQFIGREAEKSRIHEALRSRSYLVSIDGIGGIGKTVLALEVAHECLHASKGEDPTDGIATFEGFIWTTAKDRELTLNALLDAVARTLDYPGIAQQPVEEKCIAVRKLLQEQPYLVIVDNFETITDKGVRDFLLNLPEPSKALITTREQKLRRVWAISLKGLAEPEALALIRTAGKRLGLTALERGDDGTLLHLYQATGGAPLAIKWAVGQIKQRGQSLDTVLAALHEARGDIFDNIFIRSWSLLAENARQVLMVMPVFATSASREGIEAASDVHHFALDEALGQLVEMSLVDPTNVLDLTRWRYSIHPLTRAFAAAKLHRETGTVQAIHQRVAKFFQAFAKEHGGFWSEEGYAQLESELPNILAIIQWCWRNQLANVGMSTFYHINDFMIVRGYWPDAMTLGQKAIATAQEVEDEHSAAVFRIWPVGWLHRHRGNLHSAEEHVTQALDVFERLGDELFTAHAKRQLGRILQEQGQLEQAKQLFEEAIAFFESAGNRRHIYFVTANMANIALQQGDLDSAWDLCDSVLASARQFDDPERIAHLLNVLGGVARRRGTLRQAKGLWEEALSHMERANRLDEIADGQLRLAHVEIEMGREQAATQMLSKALETYRRLGVEFRVREIEELLEELPKPTDHAEREETTHQ